MNILFLLDFLFTDYSNNFSPALISTFRALARRDLSQLISSVVPPRSWDGIKLNSGVTIQILTSWRLRRLFPMAQISVVLEELEQRQQEMAQLPPEERTLATTASTLTKDEVVRRIEEDRERHKRIRERLWVLPPKSFYDAIPDPSSSSSASSSKVQLSERPAKKVRMSTVTADPPLESSEELDGMNAIAESVVDPLEIQFEDLWENTSDLNEDDIEEWREDQEERWWGSERQIRQRLLLEEQEAERKRQLEISRIEEERAAELQRTMALRRPPPPPPPPIPDWRNLPVAGEGVREPTPVPPPSLRQGAPGPPPARADYNLQEGRHPAPAPPSGPRPKSPEEMQGKCRWPMVPPVIEEDWRQFPATDMAPPVAPRGPASDYHFAPPPTYGGYGHYAGRQASYGGRKR